MLKPKEQYELSAQQSWKNYEWEDVKYHLRHYWNQYRNYNLIIEELNLFRDSKKPINVLDIGCGVISIINLLVDDYTHANYTGIDPLIDAYESMYNLDNRCEWVNGYAESLPFDNGHFDIVFTTNSIDHVENIDSAFVEISRVLKSGGSLISNVDLFCPGTPYRNEGHPNSPTLQGLKSLCSKNNLTIKTSRRSIAQPCGVGEFCKRRIVENQSLFYLNTVLGFKELIKNCIKNYIVRKGSIGELTIIAEKNNYTEQK